MAHEHRGKTSESRVRKEAILRALDIQPGWIIVCFHSLPETGWRKAKHFDWKNGGSAS